MFTNLDLSELINNFFSLAIEYGFECFALFLFCLVGRGHIQSYCPSVVFYSVSLWQSWFQGRLLRLNASHFRLTWPTWRPRSEILVKIVFICFAFLSVLFTHGSLLFFNNNLGWCDVMQWDVFAQLGRRDAEFLVINSSLFQLQEEADDRISWKQVFRLFLILQRDIDLHYTYILISCFVSIRKYCF